MIEWICNLMIILVVFKSIFFASDFSFCTWIKYGGEYYDWYSQLEDFDAYLSKIRR